MPAYTIDRLQEQAVKKKAHYISQSGHINQLDHRPLPAFGFTFSNGKCTDALHGKGIEQ